MAALRGPSAPASARALASLALLVALAHASPARADDVVPGPTPGWGAPPGAAQWTPATPPALETVRPAEGAVSEPGPSVGGDLAFVATAPIMLGAQATVELPYRFLIQGELGVLPAFAIDAVDGALVSSGAYDTSVSTLVRGGLGDALVLRLSGGMRPFPDAGFEPLVGYTLVSLGGGLDARDAVAAMGGIALPSGIPDGDVTVSSTLHSFHMSLGWRWIVADHFLIRASLGYLQTVGSSTSVSVSGDWASDATVQAAVAAANPVIDAKLGDAYTTYVKLPLVGLAMGYRF